MAGGGRSLFLSGSGTRSMMSFDDSGSGKPFFRSFGITEEGGCGMDDELDEYFADNQPGKKRRLNVEQVQFLEKSFEVENKLEPERKVQLAKDLGLQPRQVAIWFQNRRARWKTKQMEKDYDVLQASFNSLKADYDSLLKHTEKLKAEVIELSDKLVNREAEGEEEEKVVSEAERPMPEKPVSAVEDISSAKSDSDSSPRFTDSNPLLEHGDSSYVFEADQSDLSQDEEDELSRNLLPFFVLPKMEDVEFSDPPEGSCNFGFQVEDHYAFWSWSY